MSQLSIFQQILPTYKCNKPIRLIELFAGYGSQALALRYMGVEFEHWRVSEWNWKSNYAYSLIHGLYNDYSEGMTKEDLIKALQGKGLSSDWNTPMADTQIAKMKENDLRHAYNAMISTRNTVDISKTKGTDLGIEPLRERKREYMMTYSFPCQDLSLAGKGEGMEEDSKTRSSLLWQVGRILNELKTEDGLPNILMMENVPKDYIIYIMVENKRLKKTIENANLKKGEVKTLDLYNQTSSDMAHTLQMPNHNDQRLYDGYRVRKLTPRECFRLMGVRDEDFDKIKDAFSDTTLYHLAGDSIVTNVIMSALAPMFNKEEWYYDHIRSREDTM